jgi:PAS domain S-box-containing protein
MRERLIGGPTAAAVQALFGTAALALACYAGVRLQATAGTAALLLLAVIVPFALWARPLATAAVSALAILSFAQFFSSPVGVDAPRADPLEIVGLLPLFVVVLVLTPVMIVLVKSFKQNAVLTDELSRSAQRYRRVMAATGEGYWEWTVANDELYVSPRILEMYALPADSKFASRADFIARLPLHPDDRPRWERAVAEHFAGHTERFEIEVRMLPRGETIWVRLAGRCTRDAAGRVVSWTGSAADVTQRKLAQESLERSEQALRRSGERFALAVRGAKDGIWDWDLTTGMVYLSPRGQEIQLARASDGVDTKHESQWRQWYQVHPDDAPRREAAIRDHLKGLTDHFEGEWRVRRADGSYRWIHTRGICTRDATGRAVRFAGSSTDIDERKRAEEALIRSEARFRSLTGLSSDWYWEQDENLRFTYLSGHVEQLTGYTGESSLGKTRWEIANMTLLSCSWAEHQAVLAARQPFRDLECRRVGPDGTVRYLSMSGTPIFDAQGEFRGYHGVGRNITERKRAEEELRSRSEMLELAQKSARIAAFEWRRMPSPAGSRWPTSWTVSVSRELEEMFGVQSGRFDGSFESWKKLIHPDDWPKVKRDIASATHTGEMSLQYRVSGPKSEPRWLESKGRVLRDADGQPERVSGFVQDVTKRHAAEEALRQSEERFALAVAGANEGIFDWDLVSDRVYVSQRAQELYGLKPGELWRPRRDWRHLVTFHPEDTQRMHDVLKALIRGAGEMYDAEYRIIVPGGAIRWFRQRGIALRNPSGRVYRMVGSIGDITDRKTAQEDRLRLERQLRLAQRLEAVGTLAGGIAHDFNNILGAILGFGEMALRGARKGSRLRRDLDGIRTAGERGRALVERILAFSRGGVGEPVPVHVEQVVLEAVEQLQARLSRGIRIETRLSAGGAAVLGDATQVHQLVMNLGTNAMQAMPDGGVLFISLDAARCAARPTTVGNLTDGGYVVLSVADNGTGIARDVIDRIFDPFFTTKEVGTGTGLGLSLVHGIVTQLGGAIDVSSMPGRGSEFTLYLPRSGDAPESTIAAEAAMPRGGGQRVLIVDDEESLVSLATRALEELGYVPSGFTSSAAALAAFRADPQRYDALITDERMPEMFGTTLIREVRGIREAIPVLLMSGYIGGAVARQAREAGADGLLQKPLLARDLAVSLARLLRA